MNREAIQRSAAIDLCLAQPESVFTVKTGCMSPEFMPGARVRIERCSLEELRRGDVVLLRKQDQLYLHRYLGLCRTAGSTYMFCKGDRRRLPDAPWPAEALSGRAISIINEGEDTAVSLTPVTSIYAWIWSVMAYVVLKLGLIACETETTEQ